MYVCETLLERFLRDILREKWLFYKSKFSQLIYNMMYENSYDAKNWEIFKN